MAAQPITCYFRSITDGHAVRGCCETVQTWPVSLSAPVSADKMPISFQEICPVVH